MILRESSLPAGWYPREKDKVEDFLKAYFQSSASAISVMAPHAGWYFSGSLAARAISSLDSRAQTVVVIGGHLPAGMPILAAAEDGVRTPLGTMIIDKELRAEFAGQVSTESDRYNDNTVEVLLPMVHYFFPNAQLLWLRFPSEISSFEAGKTLFKTADSLNRKAVLIASADLTHYGANYGFAPKGSGKQALDWVKNVNDAGFIKAVLSGDPDQVLKRAENDRSTCSAGSVLGALAFALSGSTMQARLLEYGTSADAEGNTAPQSFVGYAAMSMG